MNEMHPITIPALKPCENANVALGLAAKVEFAMHSINKFYRCDSCSGLAIHFSSSENPYEQIFLTALLHFSSLRL